MRIKYLPILALLTVTNFCVAENSLGQQATTSTITANQIHLRFERAFEEIELQQAFENAIIEQGLLSRGIMHIHEMLQRTGKDLNLPPRYKHAAAIEFCSAEVTHLMTAADPSNFAICPFTISYYETLAEPNITHILYQIPNLKGSSEAVNNAKQTIVKMYDAIIEEATFYF